MKTAVCFLLSCIVAAPVAAAPPNMVVHLSNGDTRIVGLAAIEKITFDLEPAKASSPVALEKLTRLVSAVFPNPFSGAARVNVTVPRRGRLTATVHDLDGRTVAVLQDGVAEPGVRQILWGGRLPDGSRAPAGNYLLLVSLPNGREMRKLILIR